MKKILFSLVIFSTSCCFSQSHDINKISYRLLTSAGAAIGQEKVAPLFQVIPSIYYRKFQVGIGAGYDNYRFQSIPIFADIRYHIGKHDWFFVYGDAGYNVPFAIKKETNAFKITDEYNGGFYGDFGAGLRIVSFHRQAFLFNAGYSVKKINHVEGFSIGFPPTESFNNYYYSMERMVAKITWQFNYK